MRVNVSSGLRGRSAIGPLLAANVLVFLVQLIVPGFTDSFVLISADVLARPWILLTSMFMHADPSHLFFNMFALWMFGPLIERRIGSKRFLFIYFLSGILAGIAATFFYPAALGASGAIMGILGVTVMLMPNLQVLLFFMIPMSLRTAAILFALVDIFGIFAPTGVANIAHLVGISVGLAYGYYLLRERRSFHDRLQSKPRKREAKSYQETITMDEDDVQDFLKRGRL